MKRSPSTVKWPELRSSARLRYFTFFYLYIMQGIPAGFALTTIANYLVGRGVSSDRVDTFIAMVGLPWIAQFVWGPLIDRYQFSAMGRRKHWIVFSQWAAIIVSSFLIFIHDPQAQLAMISLIFFTHSIFASVQIASVDAMAINIGPENERGRLNAYMRGGFLIGSAIGAAGLSVVLHAYGFRLAAAMETAIITGCSIVFFFTKLDKADVLLSNVFKKDHTTNTNPINPSFGRVFRKVYFGITRAKSLRYFGVVAVTYFCSSVFIRSFTFDLIHRQHWSDRSVSLIQGGWGSALTFVGIILAGIQSDRMGAKRMQVKIMWVVCLFLLLFNGCYSLWANSYWAGSALLLWNLADPLLSVTIFPILMMLCLRKVEGSQFTTYLAMINLCDVAGSYVTGWGLTVIPAPILGFSCGLLLLTVLLWLWKTHNSAIPALGLQAEAALPG